MSLLVNYHDGNSCMPALNRWQNLLRNSRNFSHFWYIHCKTRFRISIQFSWFNSPSVLVTIEFYWVGLGPVSSWKDPSEREVLLQYTFAQPLEVWMHLVLLHGNCVHTGPLSCIPARHNTELFSSRGLLQTQQPPTPALILMVQNHFGTSARCQQWK